MTNTFECLNCKKATTNPKFCSKSCAAQVNNRLSPKRAPIKRYCKHCNIEVQGRLTACPDCNPKNVDWSKVTIGEIQGRAAYQTGAKIRGLARHVFYSQDPKPTCCANCGYSKHIQVCHRKAINEFAPTATITEVNELKNLVGLCPNCHWELDHGLLHL